MLKLRTTKHETQTTNHKAQSMLEYLILFISVVAAALIGTNAFVGPAMRNGLATMQNTAANNLINNPNPPASVSNQPYYTPTRTETVATPDNKWVAPYYDYNRSSGGAPFNPKEYYFRQGPSDMNYVPKQGTILGTVPTSSYPVPISPYYSFEGAAPYMWAKYLSDD